MQTALWQQYPAPVPCTRTLRRPAPQRTPFQHQYPEAAFPAALQRQRTPAPKRTQHSDSSTLQRHRSRDNTLQQHAAPPFATEKRYPSSGPSAHTAIDISQPTPAATPAPTLHSTHHALPRTKMQTALWQQYPARAPCKAPCSSRPAPQRSNTLPRHPAQHQHGSSKAHTALLQQHPAATPHSNMLSPRRAHYLNLSGSTLQRQPAAAPAASAKAHTPPRQQHPANSTILSIYCVWMWNQTLKHKRIARGQQVTAT